MSIVDTILFNGRVSTLAPGRGTARRCVRWALPKNHIQRPAGQPLRSGLVCCGLREFSATAANPCQRYGQGVGAYYAPRWWNSAGRFVSTPPTMNPSRAFLIFSRRSTRTSPSTACVSSSITPRLFVRLASIVSRRLAAVLLSSIAWLSRVNISWSATARPKPHGAQGA